MDIMLTGEDQSQAYQPNSLAEGPPMQIYLSLSLSLKSLSQGFAGSVKQDDLHCQCPLAWRQVLPQEGFADTLKEDSPSNIMAPGYHT
eukprot:1048723-Pelagomonas_calceolata.AAC.1